LNVAFVFLVGKEGKEVSQAVISRDVCWWAYRRQFLYSCSRIVLPVLSL
jgi:hypothetical protein